MAYTIQIEVAENSINESYIKDACEALSEGLDTDFVQKWEITCRNQIGDKIFDKKRTYKELDEFNVFEK